MPVHLPDKAPPDNSKVGIIAGAGVVPKEIAEAILATGGETHVIALRNIATADFGRIPHTVVGLGQVGGMLRALREHGCKRLMMSGGLERPNLLNLMPDLGFFLNLATILGLMRGGDDTILRKVLGFFERQGFQPVGIPEVAPSLLAHEGVMVGAAEGQTLENDAALAFRIVDQLARYDIGQAVVVRDGQPVGIEAAEGTDALLGRLPAETAKGGLLLKATKPHQDLRADLPTIGPRTIDAAARLRLSAIVVEAHRSVIAEREKTQQLAAQANISLRAHRRPEVEKQNAPARKAEQTKEQRQAHQENRPTHAKSEDDIALARSVLRDITAFCETAAVCVSRHRVISIGLGGETQHIVKNASHVRQWSDRSGRHRGAIVAVSHTKLLSAKLLEDAANMGVRQIAVQDRLSLTGDDAKLVGAAAALGIELMDGG